MALNRLLDNGMPSSAKFFTKEDIVTQKMTIPCFIKGMDFLWFFWPFM